MIRWERFEQWQVLDRSTDRLGHDGMGLVAPQECESGIRPEEKGRKRRLRKGSEYKPIYRVASDHLPVWARLRAAS